MQKMEICFALADLWKDSLFVLSKLESRAEMHTNAGVISESKSDVTNMKELHKRLLEQMQEV